MPRAAAFRSLKARVASFPWLIALLVVGALLAASLAFMAFTAAEVTRAMASAAGDAARDVLRAVALDLDNGRAQLDFFRRYARARYEQRARDLTALVVGEVDEFRRQAERGLLPLDRACAEARAEVERIRYGSNDYFFVYNAASVAIGHPDPQVKGRAMTNVVDIMGRRVLPTMYAEARARGESSCVVNWLRLGELRKVPKLLYFRYYAPWDWLIGTGIYIDDIEADARQQQAANLDQLRDTLDRIQLVKGSRFCVMDGRENILYPPRPIPPDWAHLPSLPALQEAVEHGRPMWLRVEADSSGPEEIYYIFAQYFAPLDWYIAALVPERELRAPARRILRHELLFTGLFMLAGALLAWRLVGRVTAHLERLAQYMERLQAADFVLPAAAAADLARITFPREVGQLAGAIAQMETRLREHLARWQQTIATRERWQSEMNLAREIQRGMLPHPLPAAPGVELAAALAPARDVGGDLYDAFFAAPGRLCLVIGDVSDKGVPAALFMARALTLLRHTLRHVTQVPEEALALVNTELAAGNELRMFLTALVGVLDTATGELRYSNAGHLPPLWRPAAGGAARWLDLPRGKPLGVVPAATFAACAITLAPGDTLLWYTDGVTEARDPGDGLFGEERLAQAVAGLPPDVAPDALIAAIAAVVREFAGPAEPADDQAQLALRWRPGAGVFQ